MKSEQLSLAVGKEYLFPFGNDLITIFLLKIDLLESISFQNIWIETKLKREYILLIKILTETKTILIPVVPIYRVYIIFLWLTKTGTPRCLFTNFRKFPRKIYVCSLFRTISTKRNPKLMWASLCPLIFFMEAIAFFWLFYIDDIFIVCLHDRDVLKIFLNYLTLHLILQSLSSWREK